MSAQAKKYGECKKYVEIPSSSGEEKHGYVYIWPRILLIKTRIKYSEKLS